MNKSHQSAVHQYLTHHPNEHLNVLDIAEATNFTVQQVQNAIWRLRQKIPAIKVVTNGQIYLYEAGPQPADFEVPPTMTEEFDLGPLHQRHPMPGDPPLPPLALTPEMDDLVSMLEVVRRTIKLGRLFEQVGTTGGKTVIIRDEDGLMWRAVPLK